LRRFWRWSSRESAWPISKLILAMGGTLGPAPKAMQLSQPSLLSYLQRFNKKRRVHYKIDVQPRWRSDGPGPRLRKDSEGDSETAKEVDCTIAREATLSNHPAEHHRYWFATTASPCFTAVARQRRIIHYESGAAPQVFIKKENHQR